MNKLIGLLDLDSMLHIVANVQYSAGNRDKPLVVKQHVQRFIANICASATEAPVIMFYQKMGHKNFRNDILPEYKQHRTPSEAILLWKETILEAFEEAGAYGLDYIESDDAQGILAEHIGYDKVLIITGDKDMQQIPSVIYNPFKPRLKPEERWFSSEPAQANRFMWQQVITGDPTDMPGELCGVEGVGEKTAIKLMAQKKPVGKIVQEIYTKKYGDGAFARCDLTFKMVKILDKSCTYINEYASFEIAQLINSYQDYLIKPTPPITELFNESKDLVGDINSIFNKL